MQQSKVFAKVLDWLAMVNRNSVLEIAHGSNDNDKLQLQSPYVCLYPNTKQFQVGNAKSQALVFKHIRNANLGSAWKASAFSLEKQVFFLSNTDLKNVQ